ncbi:hypothetical protein [Helicobacter cinaedi]|nr:hypothetical protein [Helicobacter cinaedi]
MNLEITKAHAGGAVSIGLDDEVNVFLNNSATTKKALHNLPPYLL